MNKLEELKKEYIKNLNISKIEVQAAPVYDRHTVEGVVNAAKQKLSKIVSELTDEVLKTSTLVLVSPKLNIDTIIKEISDKHKNVVKFDFFDLETKLISEIYVKTNNGFLFNQDSYSRLRIALSSIADFIGALYMPDVVLNASDYKAVPDMDLAVKHLAGILTRTYGNELKNAYVSKQITNYILNNLESAEKMYFFITRCEDQTLLSKMFNQVSLLTEKDEPIETAKDLQTILGKKIKTEVDKSKKMAK